MGRDGLENVGDRMGVGFEGEADVLDSPSIAGRGNETAHVGDLELPFLDTARLFLLVRAGGGAGAFREHVVGQVGAIKLCGLLRAFSAQHVRHLGAVGNAAAGQRHNCTAGEPRLELGLHDLG